MSSIGEIFFPKDALTRDVEVVGRAASRGRLILADRASSDGEVVIAKTGRCGETEGAAARNRLNAAEGRRCAVLS